MKKGVAIKKGSGVFVFEKTPDPFLDPAGPGSDGILRIATNLIDPPAQVIGFVYSGRK